MTDPPDALRALALDFLRRMLSDTLRAAEGVYELCGHHWPCLLAATDEGSVAENFPPAHGPPPWDAALQALAARHVLIVLRVYETGDRKALVIEGAHRGAALTWTAALTGDGPATRLGEPVETGGAHPLMRLLTDPPPPTLPA